MANEKSTKSINLNLESGAFTGIFRRLRGRTSDFNFSEISALRQLLSNQRARLLHTIKTENPSSIYQLAKTLGRDFKSVRHDVRLLEKFGFLELDSTRKGKREMLKPILVVDTLNISITI